MNAAVLKTVDGGNVVRGFESLPLRLPLRLAEPNSAVLRDCSDRESRFGVIDASHLRERSPSQSALRDATGGGFLRDVDSCRLARLLFGSRDYLESPLESVEEPCATTRDRYRAREALVVGALLLAALVVGGCGRTSAGTREASRAVASHSGPWSAPVTLFRSDGALLPAISCASAHLCVAVGAKGSSGVGLSGATAWSSPLMVDSGGGLAAVSCAPGSSCVAVGASAFLGTMGVTYRFLGGRWSAGPTSAFDLAAVSCPTASFCAAVDDLLPHGHGFVFNGQHWSRPISIGVSADSISCPTTTFCAAVSQTGKVLYYKNGAWSKATSIDASGTLTSVSCASASFCVAVDANGNALADSNGRWSKPAVIDDAGSLAGVSCPTTTFCVAVGSSGVTLTYGGSRWSSPHTISPQIWFTSVSCPTASFCAAAAQSSPSITGASTVYVATYRSLP